jgi:uncharacterized membrane protein
MKFYEKYQQILNIGINIIEIISYTISFLLISFGIIKSAYIYLIETINPNIDSIRVFTDAKINLSESIALSLSFILGVEILKIFYIKSYKQLIFVVCLVLIKLLITYFLLQEIAKDSEQRN